MSDLVSTVPEQVAGYMIASHARRPGHLRAGCFVVSLDPHTRSLGRNYATPSIGARPTAAEIAALVGVFERHDRTPRLEYVAGVAPAAEAALLAAGFAVDQRLSLLVCRPTTLCEPTTPPGIAACQVTSTDDLLDAASVQHDAYGEPEPPGPEDVDRLAALLARGGDVVLARDAATGQPCGAGLVTDLLASVAEVAGVATREMYRRRGVARSVAHLLTKAALERGAAIVFLDVEGPQEEAVYLGVGYRGAGERVWMTRR